MDDESKLPIKKRKRKLIVNNPEPMAVDEPIPSTSGHQSASRNQNFVMSEPASSSSSDEDILNLFDFRKKQARLTTGIHTDEFVELENAFRGILKTYFLKNNNTDLKDVCLLLTMNQMKIKRLIQNLLIHYGALKFNIVVECTYVRPVTQELQSRAFKTVNMTVFQGTSIDSILHTMFRKICVEESEYEGKGSGFSLFSVDGILVRFSRYRPLRGSSYLPLPEKVKNKSAIINPKNVNDTFCFKWAVLARFVKGPNPQRIDNRYLRLSNLFKFDNIKFPVSLKSIKRFERLNPNVSVNVYGLDLNNDVYPLRICDSERQEHFDLLKLTNNSGVSHYCYIKNLSKLVRSQLTKFHGQAVFCKRCLTHFQGSNRVSRLEKHKSNCKSNKPVRAVMPEPDDNVAPTLKFENVMHKFRLPIVIYADFECILKKEHTVVSNTTINNTHEPMSFCTYLVVDKSIPVNIANCLPKDPYLYRGKDAASHFMSYLLSMTELLNSLLKTNLRMSPLTHDEQERFENATHCESCNEEFSMLCQPVRDHCHLSGKFRSVLCNKCNLKRQRQKFIPVFIHGSSNYDSHFIVQQLGCDTNDIYVIPNSSEKYVSFSKITNSGITLRFVDTYRFLNASLSELASNLPKEKFNFTKMYYNEDEMRFVTRKGVYPYEYTCSWDKLEEVELPSKENFKNSLTLTDVSDEDYKFAKDVYVKFKCSNLGEYSDFYLRTDVLLLCDVFENFRNLCMENYELDPAHYITLPSLTFDAMLKFTDVHLELFTDYEMYTFIERGIRGGITSCVKRNAIANNPLVDCFDETKDTSYLTYIDANNLYGYAMSKPMPRDSFKWVHGNLNSFDVLSIPADSPIGYILEVDVAYPTYLHDKHNDLPFLPENKLVNGTKQKKLLTTLEEKTNYVCHYVNLQQAIQHGLVLKKVHRILKFNQSTWLKGYIDFNTEKRKNAKNNFEKDFYKLLNNAMFGKTIENIRKRMNLELVSSENRLNKLICKPNFSNQIIYNENLCAIQCLKESVYFNKPIYIGFTVLELSKELMYRFHYDVMVKMYGSSINILYVDTDSYFYHIYTNDLYDDMNKPEIKPYLDMSDYPENHKCFSNNNKKRLGCFKDECCSIPIVEFIGLRPKLYTFTTTNNEYLEKKGQVLKKAKGVTKPVVAKEITFNDYKRCLIENIAQRKNNKIFRSKKHIVQTVTINKIALSANDDKRIIMENGINTMAYGHYSVKK